MARSPVPDLHNQGVGVGMSGRLIPTAVLGITDLKSVAVRTDRFF